MMQGKGEHEMTWIIAIAAAINAIAAVVIACYACASNKLANNVHKLELKIQKQAKASMEKHRQELYDLYQAIVISTLLSGTSGSNANSINDVIEQFKKRYSGKTQIFSKQQ